MTKSSLEEKIESPWSGPGCTVRPDLELEILKGNKSLIELAEFAGTIRNNVRNYMITNDLLDVWKEKRKEIKSKDVKIIKEKSKPIYIDESYNNGNNAKKAVYEFFKGKDLRLSNKTTPETILPALERYYEAKDKGEIKSLKELSEENCHFTLLGRILDKIGEEPLYGKKVRKVWIDDNIEDAISRIIESVKSDPEFKGNYNDFAYFIGIGSYSIVERFRKNKVNKPSYSIKHFNVGDKKVIGLNLKTCSKIYQFQDENVSRIEIESRLKLNKKIINYAIKNRKSISKKIKKIIDIIYLEEDHTKPYITETLHDRAKRRRDEK